MWIHADYKKRGSNPTSKFYGTSMDSRSGKWHASIARMMKGKKERLDKWFDAETDAAAAVNEWYRQNGMQPPNLLHGAQTEAAMHPPHAAPGHAPAFSPAQPSGPAPGGSSFAAADAQPKSPRIQSWHAANQRSGGAAPAEPARSQHKQASQAVQAPPFQAVRSHPGQPELSAPASACAQSARSSSDAGQRCENSGTSSGAEGKACFSTAVTLEDDLKRGQVLQPKVRYFCLAPLHACLRLHQDCSQTAAVCD